MLLATKYPLRTLLLQLLVTAKQTRGEEGGTLNNNKVGVNSPDPRIFNKRRVLMNRGRWKIENYAFVVTEHKQAKTKYGVQKFRN